MMSASLWKDRRAPLKPVHQPRYRRDCVGELIQIDGSDHWCFENRGPRCTLLVYIDDATSRSDASAVCGEREHFRLFCRDARFSKALWQARSFYSDKLGVFRFNKKDAASGDGMT